MIEPLAQHGVRRWVQPRHPGTRRLRLRGARQQRRDGRPGLAATARRGVGGRPRARRGPPEDAVRRPLRRGRASRSPTPAGIGPIRERSVSRDRCPRSTASAADDRLAFDEGFFPAEPPTASARRGDRAVVVAARIGSVCRRSTDAAPATLSLRVVAPDAAHGHACAPASTSRIGRDDRAEPVVGRPSTSTAKPFDVINNAGSALYPGGFGGDRGFLERDDGQFDEPADVFAWCGGAVLLRRATSTTSGCSTSGCSSTTRTPTSPGAAGSAGGATATCPTRVVRHRHAASSGVGSGRSATTRSATAPLMLVKNAPGRACAPRGPRRTGRAAPSRGRS